MKTAGPHTPLIRQTPRRFHERVRPSTPCSRVLRARLPRVLARMVAVVALRERHRCPPVQTAVRGHCPCQPGGSLRRPFRGGARRDPRARGAGKSQNLPCAGVFLPGPTCRVSRGAPRPAGRRGDALPRACGRRHRGGIDGLDARDHSRHVPHLPRGRPAPGGAGWRGFALPRMQRSMHPLTAAVGLGVVHTFWHAPLFLTQEWDTARSDVGQLAAYLLLVVALSIVLSWVFNASDGSSVPAILAHNSLNWGLLFAGNMLGAPVQNTWPATLAMAVLAAVILGLTRGRLGHGTP
ncbi:CPBP family intramembrane glutamic endopeptidase [Corynebacterium pseudodiphtheriticum]|nr:CPBP family intramembrane glutamic endopeptidase [Corynebacterium pseudodiphtheriticum]